MQATSRPSWAYSTLIIIATIASFSHECCCCPCLVIKFVVLVRKSNPSRGSERRLRRLQTIVFHCRLSKNATQYRRDVWVRIALKLAFLSAFYFSNQGVDQGNDNIGLSPALNCLKPLACPLEEFLSSTTGPADNKGTASSAGGCPQQLPVRGGHDGCDRRCNHAEAVAGPVHHWGHRCRCPGSSLPGPANL